MKLLDNLGMPEGIYVILVPDDPKILGFVMGSLIKEGWHNEKGGGSVVSRGDIKIFVVTNNMRNFTGILSSLNISGFILYETLSTPLFGKLISRVRSRSKLPSWTFVYTHGNMESYTLFKTETYYEGLS